ncbi:hypothetical protein D3C71_1564790 [compost metagenome]
MIEQAQRSNVVSPRHLQGRACVELDMGIAGHQRVVGKTFILRGVGHDHDVVLQDGMATKRDVARGFAGLHAHARLEPLAVVIDQRQQGHGHVELLRRERRQPVKSFFRRRVQNQKLAQCLQAVLLVGRALWFMHGGGFGGALTEM